MILNNKKQVLGVIALIWLAMQPGFAQSPQLYPVDFAACLSITVDDTKVSGVTDFSDFPMLVDITDADLRNTANGGSMQSMSGFDIQFTGDCEDVLHHQIESYDEPTGRLIVWVRIPTLYATQATVINMYYGNAALYGNSSSTAAWNPDYDGSWHFHDDYLDATSNNNDGTNSGSSDVTGYIADGQNFDGSNDYVYREMNSIPSSFTLSAWIYPTAAGVVVAEQGQQTPSTGWHAILMEFVGTNTINVGYYDGSHFSLSLGTSYSLNNWYHVVMTFDNADNTVRGYVDGTERNSATQNKDWPSDWWLGIGASAAGGTYFNGKIDEVHVIDVAHSSDWILTEFNNQDSPGTFYSVVAGTPSVNDDVISGNIFEDLDADGVKDVGEVAHPNATVQLLDDVNEDGLVDGGDVILSTTTTDANGDYTFTISRELITQDILDVEDDADQGIPSGICVTAMGDADMGFNGEDMVCGFRFDNVVIPAGAIITKAYIEWVSTSNQSGSVELTIQGEDVDNSLAFVAANYNISNRVTRTSEQVNWSPSSWSTNQIYYSPDVSKIAQEIVDRGGWTSGNPITFLVEGSGGGKREAYGYNNDPTKAANFHFEYYVPSEFFLVNIDETTLPTNFAYTIVSEYDFNFTSCGSETSSGNDFGLQLIDICGNSVDDNNDGQTDEPYPAGIGENMLLWLKADVGFSGATWTDQSPNENDGTVYGNPTQVNNSLNFNDAIDFDGNDHIEINLPELVFENGTRSVAIFAVYKPSVAASSIGVFGNQEGSQRNINLGDGKYGSGNGEPAIAQAYGLGHHLISYIIDEENNVGGGANESDIYHNGVLHQAFTFDETSASNVDPLFHVGKEGSNGSSQFFQGDIQEIIIYYEENGNEAISDTERLQIQSYLAIKYGIALNHNYTDSQ